MLYPDLARSRLAHRTILIAEHLRPAGLVDDDSLGHFGALGLRGADLGRACARDAGVERPRGLAATAATPCAAPTEPVSPVNGVTGGFGEPETPARASLRCLTMMLMASTSTEKPMAE